MKKGLMVDRMSMKKKDGSLEILITEVPKVIREDN